MTEPNKRRHAKPKRAASPGKRAAAPADHASGIRDAVSGARSKPSTGGLSLGPVLAWLRTTPGLVVVAVGILALAFVVRLAVTGNDAAPAATEKNVPGAVNASYGNRWTSPDGYKYEISVQTLSDLVAVGSPDTCIATPPSAQATNLHFTVTITNRSKKAAPVPEVQFGTNLRPSGAVLKKLPAFAKSNKNLQITPLAKALTCPDGAALGPEGRDKIPAGGTASFTGTFGPTAVPVSRGIVVLVRYFVADGSTSKPSDLVAPFGTFPAAG